MLIKRVKFSQVPHHPPMAMAMAMAIVMAPLSLLLTFSLITFSLSSPLPDFLPVLPEPDPSSIQPLTTPTPITIPAFPEQSDLSSPSTSSSCPLSLPPSNTSLPRSLAASCSSPPRRHHCCPSLATFLYSAFAPTALSLPAASSGSREFSLPDLPDLPDDAESCAGQVERALRSKGVDLPRVNATCDVAYCYCGVRLRRLTCAGGGFEADEGKGRWVAGEETGRRLERECRRPGVAGCNRCLKALNLLAPNVTGSNTNSSHNINEWECQLMGLTWLLSKNTTLYLPAATSVLRTYMAGPDSSSSSAPTSCSLPSDDMPYAVDSSEINGGVFGKSPISTLSSTLILIIFSIFSVIF